MPEPTAAVALLNDLRLEDSPDLKLPDFVQAAVDKLGRNVTPTERVLLTRAWRLQRLPNTVRGIPASTCDECGARLTLIATEPSDDTQTAALAQQCPNDATTFARATT